MSPERNLMYVSSYAGPAVASPAERQPGSSYGGIGRAPTPRRGCLKGNSLDIKREFTLGSVLRVFVVEDHPPTLGLLVEWLAAVPGVTVVGSAQTEDRALEWLEGHYRECDAVIVDVMLKTGSGLGLLSAFDVVAHGLRCVVYTNHMHRAFINRCRTLGASTVIDKGEPGALIDCVSRWAQPPQFGGVSTPAV